MFIILMAAATAAATQAPPLGDNDARQDPIIITASRYPQPISDALADVQVLTAREIRNAGQQTLTALLGAQAGVNLIQDGGEGANATVALRGTSSGQTLVLVNGVRVASATTGAAAINNLSLGLVKRIEIVRGPRSVQYGSDAIGGVINIVTADSTYESGAHGYITGTIGNHSAYGGEAMVQYGASPTGGVDATLGYTRTAGTNFTRPSAFNYNPDLNGYRSTYAAANARAGDFFLSGQFNDFRLHYDPYPDGSDVERGRVYSGSGGVHELALGSALHLNAVFFYAADERRELYTSGSSAGQSDRFNTHRYGISPNLRAEYGVSGAKATTLVGVDYYRDKVSGNTDYTVKQRDTRAAFLQQDLDAGLVLASAGIRFERNQQFGSVTTYQLAGGLRLNQQLTARLSYGTSFRAPTFNDLYYPGFSNPSLTPEHGRNLEAGLTYASKQFDLSADFFRNHIRDQIAYDPARFNVFNVQRVTLDGFDARGKARFGQLEAHAGVEYVRPRDVILSRDLRYRPRWSADAGLTATLSKELSLSGDVSYVGRRFTDAQNETRLKGWTLVSASASYQPMSWLSLRIAADNLLNKDYEPTPGYIGQSRTVRASATARF